MTRKTDRSRAKAGLIPDPDQPPAYMFATPAGTLIATVCAAMDSDADGSAAPVTRIDGQVTVRGIEYKLMASYVWELTDWAQTSRHPHLSAYWLRLSNGKEASPRSAARRTLETLVRECLDRLHREYPQWQRQSLILHAHGALDQARRDAQAAEEALEHAGAALRVANARVEVLAREYAGQLVGLESLLIESAAPIESALTEPTILIPKIKRRTK